MLNLWELKILLWLPLILVLGSFTFPPCAFKWKLDHILRLWDWFIVNCVPSNIRYFLHNHQSIWMEKFLVRCIRYLKTDSCSWNFDRCTVQVKLGIGRHLENSVSDPDEKWNACCMRGKLYASLCTNKRLPVSNWRTQIHFFSHAHA